MSKKRHYCTLCGAKRFQKYMYLIRLHAYLKDIWVCYYCYHTKRTDVTIIKPGVSTQEDVVSIAHFKKR